MSGYRLASGGRSIDRAQNVAFRFDGESLTGFAGDTLASALVASGRVLTGRSFKYHRPRGIMSAGPEEPTALVTTGSGARATPNTPATMVELFDDLEATSQNRWPSLGLDLMAANGLFAPLLGAGFYYKTFIGQRVWHLVEPFIRRAAGMGTATRLADPDRYERTNAFCDVLVVGGGPAGLAAARTAAASGARVIVAEETAVLGGGLAEDGAVIDGKPSAGWGADCAAELAAMPNVTVLTRTTVHGYFDDNVLGAVERCTDHLAEVPAGQPRQRHWTIHAREVVLATGAIERPVVFDGNDVPGVMLAGAAHRYAARYGVAVGRSVVVFTTSDSGYRAAVGLADLGVRVVAVVDPRPAVADALIGSLAGRGIAHHPRHVVVRADGRQALRAVEVAPFDAVRGVLAGPVERIAADALAVSGGWTPSVHLASQAGTAPVFDDTIQAFVPGTPLQAWRAAGAAAGYLDLAAILASGIEAGGAAAAAAGFRCAKTKPPTVSDAPPAARPMALAEVPAARRRAKKFVDLQHDVTTTDLAIAFREGFRSVEHMKRYTTLGMATDQGKTSNLNGIALMAKMRAAAIPDLGTTRFRPPYTSVALGALAGAEVGKDYRPVRRTPMHDVNLEMGAEMIAAGPWLRPRIYPKPGESVRDAYVREARAVRDGVGMVDVTSLGKIDVQGPDAATFLDRVYANGFAKLPVGKARYGVMLRDDGIVFDDGTTWRLSEHQFLMTTTTAHAASVLSRLEFLLATAWPDLKVHVTSISDQWAGVAVAGPKARAVLATVIGDLDISNDAFPLMAVGRGHAGDIPVLVARLSFSGELAFEVYCGSLHGPALWRALMKAGAPHGMTAYGTEALGTLRIEKGHVSGPELDGRTTMADLGLGRMASRKKTYVGLAMMDRPGLTDPERPVLVGLVSSEGKPIRAGSHLVEAGGSESLGHVSSTTFSPALDKEIALALVRRGRERIGERMVATFPLKNETNTVEVVDPCFFDTDGVRLHA